MIGKTSQRQDGGDGAAQYQAGRDIAVYNVTIDDAKSVTSHYVRQIAAGHAEAGRQVAIDRMTDFDQRLIANLAAGGMLAVIRDPGFQYILKKAQVQAAITDSPADHEVLARLIEERARDGSKLVNLAVSKAIEAVEYVSDEVLQGLTAFWSVMHTYVGGMNALEVIRFSDDRAAGLLKEARLPAGRGWVDDLELIGCVRTDRTGLRTLPSWEDAFLSSHPGYISVGLDSDETEAIRPEIVAILGAGVAEQILVPHDFLPGRFRAGPSSKVMLAHQLGESARLDVFEVLDKARFSEVSPEARSNILKHIGDTCPSLMKLGSWWNAFHDHIWIELTLPGMALAYSNIRRMGVEFDNNPPLCDYLRGPHMMWV